MTGQKMSAFFHDVKVETGVGDDAAYRTTATLTPDNKPGFFIEALQRAVLFDYLGTQTMPPPDVG